MSTAPNSLNEARSRVERLVERFSANIEAYKNPAYNETQTRREFIDQFFKALGWDVDNEAGYAPAYKDVIHEDAIKVGGMTKAPDYCFRIGGQRKFFVEAKKPSVDMKNDPEPYYQLRRYGFSAKLPLSIVTDFEELAVVDCRAKPSPKDKASTGRIRYWRYDEYLVHFEEIYNTFSKEAVLTGSFDRSIAAAKTKRGTGEVDKEFLKEIENWRDLLARNIALRNTGLTQRQLNEAVQLTIDRIIFLRICEDRGIEEYGVLQGAQNGANVYARLCQMFQRADERYNSGLFHFNEEKGRSGHPDDLTLNLKIDDRTLKEILKGLYYPDCPYEFSVLPADILGQVYEQFLGKVIRLTAGHQAKVEDKPEVKKAGGVYYTPTYIVDYIVKNTVGKLLGCHPDPNCPSDPNCHSEVDCHSERSEESALPKNSPSPKPLTPKQAENLRILDPACGSGSFLIGAYEYLMDWHRDWYTENDPDKWAKGKQPRLFAGKNGWQLTTAEKKRILLNNIHGVDIDPQAVEVTKLSLLLKVLEEESQETINSQLKFFHERALPDLSRNIKCGNSLIGTDFYEGQQMGLLDEEEQLRINPFDWDGPGGFPEIMKLGGFDAVIGNPPYGVPFSSGEIGYFRKSLPMAQKFPDSYCLFMVEALNLLRKSGICSFIVPNTFCDLENCDTFRKQLLDEYLLDEIWQSGWAFKTAVVDTLVFRIINEKPSIDSRVLVNVYEKVYRRQITDFFSNSLSKIDYRNSEGDKELIKKIIPRAIELSYFATIKAGVKMYEKGKGRPPQSAETMKSRPYSIKGKSPEGWRALYRGKDISRYLIAVPEEFVDYGPWLAAPRNPELFSSPRILMRRTDYHLLSTLERNDSICVNSCHVIKLKENIRLTHTYLLGLLNSRLMQRIFELQNPQMVGKVFAEIKVIYVERLPINPIDFTDPTDKSRHDQIVELVERMLELNKRLQAAKTAYEKDSLQRQIDATDRQIDRLVYELYDLTAEEIKIVEEGTNV
ncbi:MAG: TaqI-like C-terminal specificity domain-containing protein [Thermoleophilia bacterium]